MESNLPRGSNGNTVREGFQQPNEAPTINGQVVGNPDPGMETQPPPPAPLWPVKVKLLHKPIRDNNGREVKELSFREPTGGDINRCGNPCRVDQNGDVIIDERKMSLIMANLSGILSPLLDTMDPRDWNSCAYRLRGFFLPELEAW